MFQRDGGRDGRGKPAASDRERGADRRRPESISRAPRPSDDRYGSGTEEGEVTAGPGHEQRLQSRRTHERERGRDGRGSDKHERAGPSGSSGRSGRTTPVQPHNSVLAHAAAIAKQKLAAMERQERQEDGGASPSGRQAVGSKRKHEAITWASPKRQAVGAGDDSRPARHAATPPMSMLDRAAREAEELRRHLEEAGMEGDMVMAASPSFSGSEPEDGMLGGGGEAASGDAGAAAGQGASPDSGRANGGGGSGGRAPHSRWLDTEEDDQGAAAPAAAKAPGKGANSAGHAVTGGDGNGDAGAPAPAPRSRWHVEEEEDEDEDAARRPAGGQDEAGTTAMEDDIEELNRTERAELAAGGPSDSDATPACTYDGADGYVNGGTPQRSDGLGPYSGMQLQPVDMLRESRSVDEYEKLNKISEGTYGVVFRAREKKTGRVYALKKIKLDKDVYGFPQTSIREINVLLSVHHPNIVNVTEVVVGSGYNNVYMVMEYVDADLRNLLDNELKKQPFSTAQVKCLMKQLLQGVAYLHDQWVLHRDLKTSNLLYSNTGQLKICDFGLARQYGSPLKVYSQLVVTLWYRAIERFLNEEKYSTPVDMWSVGCIMAELLSGEPLFQGRGEIDMVNKIFSIMGTPTEEEWPGWQELSKSLTFKQSPRTLRQRFPKMSLAGGPTLSDAGYDLLCGLLELNPQRRLTASEALKHRWFSESPLPAKQELMPAFRTRGMQ